MYMHVYVGQNIHRTSNKTHFYDAMVNGDTTCMKVAGNIAAPAADHPGFSHKVRAVLCIFLIVYVRVHTHHRVKNARNSRMECSQAICSWCTFGKCCFCTFATAAASNIRGTTWCHPHGTIAHGAHTHTHTHLPVEKLMEECTRRA